MSSDLQDYIVPFSYSGFSKIKARSAAEAREMFDAMDAEERLRDAEFWADDRTMTPAEYEAEIKAVVEGPSPA